MLCGLGLLLVLHVLIHILLVQEEGSSVNMILSCNKLVFLFGFFSRDRRGTTRQRQIRRYKVGGPCPERFEPALRTYIPNYEDSCSQRRIFISKELYVEEPLPDPRHVTTLLNVQGERGFMSLSPLAV